MLTIRSVDQHTDMAFIETGEHGTDAWARVFTRKQHECSSCCRTILKGQPAWRPITNKSFRRLRFCDGCVVYSGHPPMTEQEEAQYFDDYAKVQRISADRSPL